MKLEFMLELIEMNKTYYAIIELQKTDYLSPAFHNQLIQEKKKVEKWIENHELGVKRLTPQPKKGNRNNEK